jgi:hypothetical protein
MNAKAGLLLARALLSTALLSTVLLTTGLGLIACGQSAEPPAGKAAPATPKTTRPVGAPLERDTVRAVNAAHSTTPIDLRFELQDKPMVNTASGISLAVIPDAKSVISHIRLSFQTVDGLDLADTGPVSIDRPEPGVALTQNVGVVPRRAGVLYLTVTALIDDDNGSLSRSYTIPIVVANAG